MPPTGGGDGLGAVALAQGPKRLNAQTGVVIEACLDREPQLGKDFLDDFALHMATWQGGIGGEAPFFFAAFNDGGIIEKPVALRDRGLARALKAVNALPPRGGVSGTARDGQLAIGRRGQPLGLRRPRIAPQREDPLPDGLAVVPGKLAQVLGEGGLELNAIGDQVSSIEPASQREIPWSRGVSRRSFLGRRDLPEAADTSRYRGSRIAAALSGRRCTAVAMEGAWGKHSTTGEGRQTLLRTMSRERKSSVSICL